ncbi:MAG: bifunctional glutamate N-acetyltransferase/amino-acid acetyltransferase ArgJ [Oscillospiraceae bacterium]|jgi:glutamate N-acetyltransferase/amino-acid N-acetyltransferase|nr:bifunctional glutamate N-acetyltransferase/amino-acid acetyltransferase ArgJ [Oscillospiraceae bacterium]
MIKIITGGVCAPQGFKAAGIHCGIRRNKSKRDLALIYSEYPASAAAVYTTNRVQGAPIAVTRRHLADGTARAIICNSGNANTCNADGEKIAEQMCALAAAELGLRAQDIAVASTGVIGQPLDITPIAGGIPELALELSVNGGADAADAIMTTDTRRKEIAVEFVLGGKICRMGGIAKGSGMIHPNMATMLVFITTDANIAADVLQTALREDCEDSFHMISVDGDTSTNDTVLILANGGAINNEQLTINSADYQEFRAALRTVTTHLCREIARDGEGATRLLTCSVTGAAEKSTARRAAKSVICSSLVKAAMFGADANWGRVLCALGYGVAELQPERVDVAFSSAAGRIEVCRAGSGLAFSEENAKQILTQPEVTIEVNLHSGQYSAAAWGCDLTYDYVKINGDYRT